MLRSPSTSRPYPPRRDPCRSARRHRPRVGRHSRPPCEPRSRGLPALTRPRSSTSPRTLGSAPVPRVPRERSLGSATTLLPQSHATPSSSRPARRRPARSPRRPRRPVPAGSCSSPSCSSRSRRRASLPGRRGASGRAARRPFRPPSRLGTRTINSWQRCSVPSARRDCRAEHRTQRPPPSVHWAVRASRSDPRLGSRPRGGLERWGRRPVEDRLPGSRCVRWPERGRVRRPRPKGGRDSDARSPLLERRRDRNAGRPRGSERSGVRLGVGGPSGRTRRPRRAQADPVHHQLAEVGERSGGRPARDVALAGEVRAIRPCGGAALQRHVHSLRADGAPAARAVLGGVERAECRKQPRAPADRGAYGITRPLQEDGQRVRRRRARRRFGQRCGRRDSGAVRARLERHPGRRLRWSS